MRRINCQPHQTTTNQASNRHRHDPREEQQAYSLPVDCLEGSVAETDTDGRARDAHRCRDGERILREDEDGDGGAHFHGGATRGGVVCEFVAHDYCSSVSQLCFRRGLRRERTLHDVVAVGDETDADHCGGDAYDC